MNIKYLSGLTLFLFVLACTPKTTEPVKETKDEASEVVTPANTEKELSPCKNWLELPKEEQDKVKVLHSLYRDVMKNVRGASDLAKFDKADVDRAFENWKTVYEVAPAADGERNTHYGDGIKFYEFKASQEKDSLVRAGYIQRLLLIYDEVMRCYGREGFTIGRKAFDLYYKYPDFATDIEKFNMFKRSFDLKEEEAPAFIFNPFTSLLANLVVDEKITIAEASPYATMMLDILEENKEKLPASEWTGQGWDVVESYAPARLKTLEGVKGFYDCEYYKEQYYSAYENAQNDCDSIILVLSRMKWADCAGNDPQVDAVFSAYNKQCKISADPQSTCRQLLAEGKYGEAADCYEQKAQEVEDKDKAARYMLTSAKIYYGELKQYSKARNAAYSALEYKSNWGEPYLLIGKLYASSGPLCGPGRGWDSQIVTWPAIDKWQKAKSVDSSVASEANKLINRYTQYMPSVEDVFQRSLKEGQTFRVGCWIQETTTIRAAK
jgi:hypothetical protein